ncbi:MAG: 3-phosphoshikimate 1-carboxyvinyltransferase [Verrucomicrobiota bacterium]|nr:3-phosphoshikimate 1-carboxyvinyltransferase [Verrucomicrobiota bacterium]
MNSTLDIIPFKNGCSGEIIIPGSKSISNRALLLAALSNCRTTLSGVLKSQDVELMIKALKTLGIGIIENWVKNEVEIQGCGGTIPQKTEKLYVGNAGTVARFLTAWLAIQKNATYHMDGSLEMRKRPISQLLNLFQDGGVDVIYAMESGFFPFTLNTNSFNQDKWMVDATKSSQILSALMMIAPLCSENQSIEFQDGTVSLPFLAITRKMMEDFCGDSDFECKIHCDHISIKAKYLRNEDFHYEVEPDATAASYFITLPQIVGGSCKVVGIWDEMLQGDSRYSNVLRLQGGLIERGNTGLVSSFSGQLTGGEFDFNDISDTFLTLVAISPLLTTPLKISGIAHTRLQETDRVKAMAVELKKLGQKVIEKEDSLEIMPNLNKLKEIAENKIQIETYHDHRVAMSFGILGSYDLFGNGKSWLTIQNPSCCEKTFPDFFDRIEALRNNQK